MLAALLVYCFREDLKARRAIQTSSYRPQISQVSTDNLVIPAKICVNLRNLRRFRTYVSEIATHEAQTFRLHAVVEDAEPGAI